MKRTPVLILGGGPTGLGAALRARELGVEPLVLEASDRPGGLARSFVDDAGFTWDLGSHLQFSHYERYDRLLDEALPESEWLWHERATCCRVADRYVPYPIQSHLRHLPPRERWDCVRGLLESGGDRAEDFDAWLSTTFGDGLCELFMRPYNRKVWACEPERMGVGWIGERVAAPGLESVLRGICLESDPDPWGPNATFRYPRRGGTGALWTAVGETLPEARVETHCRAVAVDLDRRIVTTEDGRRFAYEVLVSTVPLPSLVKHCGRRDLVGEARGLVRVRTHVVGVGLEGEPPETIADRCWIYVPDPDVVFHRVTLLGRMSPANVPDGCWSLMFEISEPSDRTPLPEVVERVVDDARRIGLRPESQRIRSRWHRRLEHGYPVPTRDRDERLARLLPVLRNHGVYSRGRFGAWRYEVSNQDHSFMQGVEAVQHAIRGDAELTVDQPDLVNGRRNPFPFDEWTRDRTTRRTA